MDRDMMDKHLAALWAVSQRAAEYEEKWVDLWCPVEVCARCKGIRIEAYHGGLKTGAIVPWDQFLACVVPETMLFDALDGVIQRLFAPPKEEALH